jgi:uncharacterized protein DUF4440
MNDILHTLNELNSAWRERRFDDLARFFDADILMKGPGLKELARGREALVQSYAGFMAQSRIVDYAESDHFTHSWEHTGVVTYNWTMTYEQKAQTKHESGQDMFVFLYRDSHWVAILRLMLF